MARRKLHLHILGSTAVQGNVLKIARSVKFYDWADANQVLVRQHQFGIAFGKYVD